MEVLNNTLDQLNAPGSRSRETAVSSLGATEFLRLMTAQLANQDPLDPQSNEEMLAQLAQFTTVENSTVQTATLEDISAKLDALIAAQEKAAAAAQAARASASQIANLT